MDALYSSPVHPTDLLSHLPTSLSPTLDTHLAPPSLPTPLSPDPSSFSHDIFSLCESLLFSDSALADGDDSVGLMYSQSSRSSEERCFARDVSLARTPSTHLRIARPSLLPKLPETRSSHFLLALSSSAPPASLPTLPVPRTELDEPVYHRAWKAAPSSLKTELSPTLSEDDNNQATALQHPLEEAAMAALNNQRALRMKENEVRVTDGVMSGRGMWGRVWAGLLSAGAPGRDIH